MKIDQSHYVFMIVKKYLDQATVKPDDSSYKRPLPQEFTATKQDCKNDLDKLAQLTREFNIDFQLFIGALIYLLATRVEIIFAVSKFCKYTRTPGQNHYLALVHLLPYL